MSLFMYSFMWTCSILYLDMCLYIVVLILSFEPCFVVGMSLCMDKFLLWYHCCLWSYVSLFMVDIWYISFMCDMWCVCVIEYPL